MYSSIIEIKKTVPSESLVRLRKIAEKAFSNRAGSVENSSNNPYELVFSGGEDKFGCLEVGMDDPSENCDILKVLASPVY